MANVSSTTSTEQNELPEKIQQVVKETRKINETANDYSQIEKLDKYEKILIKAHTILIARTGKKQISSSGIEWYLDNFYGVKEAIALIRDDLPETFFQKLPAVKAPNNTPRIYIIAKSIVHQYQIDLGIHKLNSFLTQYQSQETLRMSELWALPLMLRLVIIETLSASIIELIKSQADLSLTTKTIQSPSLEIDRDEIVARSIRSIQFLAQIDWKTFFEHHAAVEKILNRDPAGVYERMDFKTRDHYRDVLEQLASKSPMSEMEIAEKLISCASGENQQSQKRQHIGYFLLGKGAKTFKDEIGYQKTVFDSLKQSFFEHAAFLYTGSIIILTALVLFGVILSSRQFDLDTWQLGLISLLALIPASSVSVNLINALLTWRLKPQLLPKMDFEQKVPKKWRTIVVIPALLTTEEEINFLTSQLERHYLANHDDNIRFLLLSDFADAPKQEMPEDESLLELIKAKINNLNLKYGQNGTNPFFLLHRERKWNPKEDAWMGWERKRGKLHQLNQLILQGENQPFSTALGDQDFLENTQFVITIDADTILPRGTAKSLIATLAHPLNLPEFENETHQVIDGYTILQPRTEVKPTSVIKSFFTRVFAGDIGLDLYTRAVSDVYQDLFGEGIYVGKGIYHVAAFEKSLNNQVPENSLLSHDLLEGVLGRAGLVSDIVIYEDYPPNYESFVSRLHRWVRGDWQLLPWLIPWLTKRAKDQTRRSFSLLDIWKIIDNLRRSLLAPTSMLLLLVGWFFLENLSWLWTLLILFLTAFPLFKDLVVSFSSRLLLGARENFFNRLQTIFFRWLFWILFLPYRSLVMSDAILTTLVRLLISHKRLLQWQTSAHTIKFFGQAKKLTVFWSRMLGAPLLSIATGIILCIVNPNAFWSALPLLSTWVISPQIALWISKKTNNVKKQRLDEAQKNHLRKTARKTWLYFERFIGPEDHWLPPDHFQEDPKGLVAHRTSPTNIGLMLLSTTSAYNLGYIGVLDYLLRIDYAFNTLDDLEKYRGHLLNWYDTRTKSTLSPRYVSTVDSGNFAASLMALGQALTRLKTDPICPSTLFLGVFDSLGIFCDLLDKIESKALDKVVKSLKGHCQTIKQKIEDNEKTASEKISLLADFQEKITDPMRTLTSNLWEHQKNISQTLIKQLRFWSDAIYNQLANIDKQIQSLAPWMHVWQKKPEAFSQLQFHKKEALSFLMSGDNLANPLQDMPDHCQKSIQELTHILESSPTEEVDQTTWNEIEVWIEQLLKTLKKAQETSSDLLSKIQFLSRRIDFYLDHMEFKFLYDDTREVFYLGYQVGSGRLDKNHYDLMASEARTASLIAIAKNDVPNKHWLHLNKPYTLIQNVPTLISWNGSMFEYLMPNLFFHTYPQTMLRKTIQGAVQAQINYTPRKNIPWGISESSYFRFDSANNYQYRGFGVPSLGRKRGLADDLVITPYASLMAIAVQPKAVLENIQKLESIGMSGFFGFYEAIDYTSNRLPVDQDQAIIKSYMTHHQGMILIALANYLIKPSIPQQLHRDPRIQTIELLLQEQIPQTDPDESVEKGDNLQIGQSETDLSLTPWMADRDTPHPQILGLSNGTLQYMSSNSGSGYLQWGELALTRWRRDAAKDNWGLWFYLQDLDSGEYWSIGEQPVRSHPDEYRSQFNANMVEIRRVEKGIQTNLQSTIPPKANFLLQRIHLTNQTDQKRQIRLLSYGEVVLAPQKTDQQHPAFNKMFIESHWDQENHLLVFERRLRSSKEETKSMAHGIISSVKGQLAYETDRKTFIGRGHHAGNPLVLSRQTPLSGTTGITLDPIFSIEKTILLAPRESLTITYFTAAGQTPEAIKDQISNFETTNKINQAFSEAENSSSTLLRRLEMTSDDLQKYQALLGSLIYPTQTARANATILAQNTLGQSDLWPFGISGDYPILLVLAKKEDDIAVLRDLLAAHAYWRKLGFMIDLVILNVKDTGYTHTLNERIHHLINVMDSGSWVNRRGGIFVLTASQMEKAHQILIKSAASVLINPSKGDLESHLARTKIKEPALPPFIPAESDATMLSQQEIQPPDGLGFENCFGGFTNQGSEYQIFLENYPSQQAERGQITPAPWVNVIANHKFGFLISESGSGFTWSKNSGENRLTPWRNDPVCDLPGEMVYFRDEVTGKIWSPTPLPAGKGHNYLVSHGQGYTRFESINTGFEQTMTVFADANAPVKIISLKLKNETKSVRRITMTYYAEWILSANREDSQLFIVPEFDNLTGTLMARNTYSAAFSERVAFLTSDQPVHGLTTDRKEFLGLPADLAAPVGLNRIGLTGTVEAGKDPCAALQIHVNFDPGEEKTVHFILGQGKNKQDAQNLAKRFSRPEQVIDSWRKQASNWDELLDKVQIETPDPGFDTIMNRWLPYQALSCRIWGRSAFYQSSGAYGFRDQLQDVLSVLTFAPEIARKHILRAAEHQFSAGDVLHWWHPPSGRGVRTRISDDLLWLVFVVHQYIKVTGDSAILQEKAPFRIGDPLEDDEEERYGHYKLSEETASIFEHCHRALQKANTKGPRGLPLIGSGDWNDGMNRVGHKGKGESVWLAWFLYENMRRFADLCDLQEQPQKAKAYRKKAKKLLNLINQVCWDDDWYLRAFYDDGTPLGSHMNEECQIDSLPQSWSILTGGGTTDRQEQALKSLKEKLLKKEDQMLLLFTPPFNHTENDPGYIKGYPPGIRENGGQYTHAAIWAVWAMTEQAQGNEAFEAFKILNPLTHSSDRESAIRYAVEPYVVAADIYSHPDYLGRGGWTWYTGSSGWLYRLGLEAILGFQLEGDRIIIDPCIPDHWDRYRIHFHHHDCDIEITVKNPDHVETGVKEILRDGQPISEEFILLDSSKQQEDITIVMG